jgi:hypothetical protein
MDLRSVIAGARLLRIGKNRHDSLFDLDRLDLNRAASMAHFFPSGGRGMLSSRVFANSVKLTGIRPFC